MLVTILYPCEISRAARKISDSFEAQEQTKNDTTKGIQTRFEPGTLASLKKLGIFAQTPAWLHTSSAARMDTKKVSPTAFSSYGTWSPQK